MLDALMSRLAPGQAGALWIGLLVTFLVFGDFDRLGSRRNLALLGLLALAPFLVDLLSWEGTRARVAFTLIYLMTAGYTVWALVLSRGHRSGRWRPNLSAPALKLLLGALVLMNAAVVFGKDPDDAGRYTNLGAQRWVETGRLPYADPLLKGPGSPAWGAAATYGPLLYAPHIPLQVLVGAERNPANADPMSDTYVRPPLLATQIACFLFYLSGLAALLAVVRRLTDEEIALGVAAVYAALPYLAGLGGREFVIGGLPFISHIAPSAVLLVAFWALNRPWLAGALVAAAAGVLFWPAFVFPAWFGWYLWRNRAQAIRFAGGFAIAGAAVGALVIGFTPATEESSSIDLFVESTLEHQEGTGPLEYGSSQFSFWGTNPAVARMLQTPIFGSTSLFKPTFLAYAALVLATFFLARGRSVAQLAALTAALGAGVQLWKTHASGSYIEWYIPFLMIALFAATAAAAGADRAVESGVPEESSDLMVPAG